jgi:hypothetical protein
MDWAIESGDGFVAISPCPCLTPQSPNLIGGGQPRPTTFAESKSRLGSRSLLGACATGLLRRELFVRPHREAERDFGIDLLVAAKRYSLRPGVPVPKTHSVRLIRVPSPPGRQSRVQTPSGLVGHAAPDYRGDSPALQTGGRCRGWLEDSTWWVPHFPGTGRSAPREDVIRQSGPSAFQTSWPSSRPASP